MRHIPAVFFGQLAVSNAKPRGSLSGGGDVNVGATVSAELNVRLLSTSTGGTLWSSSAASQCGPDRRQRRPPAEHPAKDPAAAYAQMVTRW